MIKQPFWALVSLAFLAAIIAFAAERFIFLQKAERTIGKVTEITSRDTTCGRRRSRYSCTKYTAVVQFSTETGTRHTLTVSAGSARGYSQPESRASFHMHDGVPVLYDPDKPTKAYHDALWELWGLPISLAMFQIGALFASLTEPRKKHL